MSPSRLASLLSLAALLAASPAWAQPGAHAPDEGGVRGEDLSISIITFGPHEHPFFKFGHNALLVEHVSGQGQIYNWGMFDFSSPALIPKFVLGRSMYWLARTPRDATIAAYIRDNRTVEVQELDLDAVERKRLYERLEDNARPENRYYLYDYFLDNCSTRVREAIDGIVGGRLRTAGANPARLTFRAHSLRLTADLTWEYLALYFLLGPSTDRRIDRFAEGFIPMELRDLARTVMLPASASAASPRRLVKSEKVVFRAERSDPPLDPPNRLPWFLLTGLLLGGPLALMGFLGSRRLPAERRGLRIAFGAGVSLLGFLGGLLGALLLFLWLCTNHRATHANANVLQSAPFAVALLVYGISVARGRRGAARKVFLIAAACAGLAALGLVLKLVGLVGQDNLPFVAVFLPLWTGMTYGVRALERDSRSTRPSTT